MNVSQEGAPRHPWNGCLVGGLKSGGGFILICRYCPEISIHYSFKQSPAKVFSRIGKLFCPEQIKNTKISGGKY